jgi:glycosyltransferase involved in cell wall biosynthesis
MKKKLLISVSYYSPHISGLTYSVKNLAELLARNRYEVTVLTTQHTKILPLRQRIIDVTIHRIPYLFRLSKGFVMPMYLPAVFQEVKQTDIVLITLPQLEGFLIALFAKLLKKKVICLYICDVTFTKGIIPIMIEQILRIMNHICLMLADDIVTLTEDFAKTSSALSRYTHKITAIPPVIMTPHIATKAMKHFASKMPQGDTYRIGFLGRLSAEKGIEYLLQAIPFVQKQLNQNVVIVLAGPENVVGEDICRKNLQILFIKYKKHIIFLGELLEEEIGAFYESLDIFVLPSINATEAYGMVQGEAMLCGTPVITTNLPGVRVPITKTGMGIIVPIKDSKAIANGIVKILMNKKHYIKSKAYIKDQFSQNNILTAYHKILNDIC